MSFSSRPARAGAQAVCFALAVVLPTAAAAQTPTPGTDISGKQAYLKPLSVLRYNESFLSKPYTLARVALEVVGRGRCNDGWCPVTHNNVALFARRNNIDLVRPTTGPVVTERSLRQGDTGEDVRALQDLLVKRGSQIKIDGVYGRGTVAAVTDFQRKNGLKADGVVGPETRQRLAG